MVMLIIDEENLSKESAALVKAARPAAEKFLGQFIFATVNGTQFSKCLDQFKIEEARYAFPSLRSSIASTCRSEYYDAS